MQSKSFPSTQRGLTLIEGCVTLAIVSILAGTALPSFKDMNKKVLLDGSAGEIVTDIQFARSEAVARQQGVRVSFHAAGGASCLVIHTGATADCGCDASGVAQCTGPAVLLKSSFVAAQSGMAVTANVASMRFDPVHGTVTPTGTVTVAGAGGPTVQHVVNILGRVRSCSPNASAKGYRAC